MHHVHRGISKIQKNIYWVNFMVKKIGAGILMDAGALM